MKEFTSQHNGQKSNKFVSKKSLSKVKPREKLRKMSRRKPGKKKKKTKTKTTTTTRTRTRPNYKAIQSQTPPPSTSSSESVIINNNLDHVIQNLKQENDKVVVERKDDDDDGPKRFYGCYLLTSLSPRFKGHSYIGFTVNPKRRIRQHNGEITCGAFKTKKKRPWEMILCIHGFPSHTSALQFEWAWQHPRKSLAVQEAAASFKTLGGLANKIKLALTMLTLHSWQSMNLTVSFFSTKYMNHAAGCPSLPQQMKLHFCSMDELPCYSDYPHVCDDEDDFDSNDSGSANYSDDRLEASADDSMETNLPSDHLQSCTVQNPSDSFLAGDQIGCGGLWEFEPSSVMGVPEQLMQPVHQLPVDVSGSMLNTSNELFWPGEEFWNEDVRGSFPDLEEQAQPTVSICTPENNIFPALEGKQSPCQLPADVRTSTWNDSYENTRLRNEDGSGTEENNIFPALEEKLSPCQLSADVPTSTWNDLYEHTRLRNEDESETEERRSSVHVMEEQIQPFQQVAPETEQSAMVDLVSVVEDTANKDETTCIVLDDIINQNEDGSGTEERRSSLHVMEEQIQPFQQVVPEREQSTMVGLVSVIEDAAKNDETTCIIIDDINEEKCQPKRVRSPLRPSNTHRAFSTEGIEVIELCTPSPDCRIITGSKKRRVNSGIPDIIDLTRSPSFIQL